MTNSHSRHCEECSLRRSNPSSAENPKSSRLSHHQYQNAFGSAGRKACVRSPAQVKTQRAQALCVASLGNPSTSRPSTESASPKGFTLIEILIVIVIISIVSGIAALTITRNQQRDLQNLANSLTHLITLAEEEAILRPAILGLGFTPTQYQFFHYHHQVTEDHPQHWRAMTDKIFGSHPIPKNIYLRVVVQGKSVPLNGQPQIIISSSGDIVPLVILIGKTNARPTYQVIGNSNGEIKSELVHEK
jgi:general secretion pathway protein H